MSGSFELIRVTLLEHRGICGYGYIKIAVYVS